MISITRLLWVSIGAFLFVIEKHKRNIEKYIRIQTKYIYCVNNTLTIIYEILYNYYIRL